MTKEEKLKAKKVSAKREKFKFPFRKFFVGVLIAILAILVTMSAFYLYFRQWKSVYAVVEGSKIYNYTYYYVQNEVAKKMGLTGTIMNPADPKSTYYSKMLQDMTLQEVITRRMLYLQGLEDGFIISDEQLASELDKFKGNLYVSEGQDRGQAYQEYLQYTGLSEKELLDNIKESKIVEKVTAKLTENLSVSEGEIKSFFDQFSSAYIEGSESKNEAYKNHYDAIKRDALKAKIDDYMRDYKNKLIDDIKQKNTVSFDNPLKKFMRWWYGNFLGLTAPTEYNLLQLP